MTYSVKEIFITLQGEGARVGRRAVFCRFTGCNLWNGVEKDRMEADCTFCDTDFVGVNGKGGGKFGTTGALVEVIEKTWLELAKKDGARYVVFTGGEPSLQINSELLCELKQRRFECAVETNGTLPLPPEIDWITVSPKTIGNLETTKGNELKLVFPQRNISPDDFCRLEFDHFFLQPMDSNDYQNNLRTTVDYCLRNPQWKLSLQTHKVIGID